MIQKLYCHHADEQVYDYISELCTITTPINDSSGYDVASAIINMFLDMEQARREQGREKALNQ